MKKNLKILFGFLAVLCITGFAAYTLVALNLDAVTNFSVKEKGLTYQVLSWKKNDKASGYKIYQQNADSNDFTLIKTINSADTTSCKIDQLDMESFYTFKISAFKSVLGFEKDSEMSKSIKTCTLPRGENINYVTENTPKTLTVSWSSGLNCDGYEVSYALNSDFSDAQIKEVNGKTTLLCKLDNLQEGKTYYVRLRSFINFEGEKLYSEYSEAFNATIKNVAAETVIDPSKPVIALTFDDGPDFNGSSKRILDVLEKYDVKATFFTVGENAKNNPNNLKRKVSLGCEIGNHTYAHNHYGSSVTAADIKKCSDVIQKITGSRPTVFRSTGGITTQAIKNTCIKEGMSLYYWSIDTEDWKSRNAKKVYKKAMKAKDGDIILMHDIYSSTADAVEKIVPKLKKKGFQFVTVSELIKFKTGSAPRAGVQYLSGTKTNG